MKKIRIMLADDNETMRNALAMFLESDSEMVVVAQAVDGVNVLAQLDAVRPDIICMDINMGLPNGIDTTLQVLRLHPQIKIIGLSANADPVLVANMAQAGAMAYVVKGNAGAELLTAIRAVHQGTSYFSPELGIDL